MRFNTERDTSNLTIFERVKEKEIYITPLPCFQTLFPQMTEMNETLAKIILPAPTKLLGTVCACM